MPGIIDIDKKPNYTFAYRYPKHTAIHIALKYATFAKLWAPGDDPIMMQCCQSASKRVVSKSFSEIIVWNCFPKSDEEERIAEHNCDEDDVDRQCSSDEDGLLENNNSYTGLGMEYDKHDTMDLQVYV